MGAELDPLCAVPEHSLLGDPQVTEEELGDQPGPGRAALRPHPGGQAGRAGTRALGREQPRALGPFRVVVVFLLQHELVGRPAEQLGARALVQDPAPGAAAARVGLDEERAVLDRRAAGRLPATRLPGTRVPGTRVPGTRVPGTRSVATRPAGRQR